MLPCNSFEASSDVGHDRGRSLQEMSVELLSSSTAEVSICQAYEVVRSSPFRAQLWPSVPDITEPAAAAGYAKERQMSGAEEQ
jgi:hypothetical protein